MGTIRPGGPLCMAPLREPRPGEPARLHPQRRPRRPGRPRPALAHTPQRAAATVMPSGDKAVESRVDRNRSPHPVPLPPPLSFHYPWTLEPGFGVFVGTVMPSHPAVKPLAARAPGAQDRAVPIWLLRQAGRYLPNTERSAPGPGTSSTAATRPSSRPRSPCNRCGGSASTPRSYSPTSWSCPTPWAGTCVSARAKVPFWSRLDGGGSGPPVRGARGETGTGRSSPRWPGSSGNSTAAPR